MYVQKPFLKIHTWATQVRKRAMSLPYGSIMGSLNGVGFVKRKYEASDFLFPESLNLGFQNVWAMQVSKGPSPYF